VKSGARPYWDRYSVGKKSGSESVSVSKSKQPNRDSEKVLLLYIRPELHVGSKPCEDRCPAYLCQPNLAIIAMMFFTLLRVPLFQNPPLRDSGKILLLCDLWVSALRV